MQGEGNRLGKWFAEAWEIESLRQEISAWRMGAVLEIERLKVQLRYAVEGVGGPGVSARERELVD
ncbi:MAG: hypothetical protein Q3999_07000 [Buchananella hordeovulneris]|nr:hypothetical protein [Buchananella hordeovulneris]